MSPRKWLTIPSMPYGALAAVAGLGLCVATAMDAFLGVADALTADLYVVFAHVPPPRTGGLDIIHACFRSSDFVRGERIAVLLLLLGGVPCALIAAAVHRARPDARWSGEWSAWVHAGLVFQMSCLVLTLFLCAVATTVAIFESFPLLNPVSAILLSIVACNVRGLRAWRALQCDSPTILLRLSP